MEDKYKILIGWKEWVSLSDLGIPSIKAKVDTGAYSSSLHTSEIETYNENGINKVKFAVYPIQKNNNIKIYCNAEIIDKREIKNSGGEKEFRYVIKTMLQIDKLSYPIEITLSNRKKMKYRMLLGRTALKGNVLIDPEKSFITGYIHKKSYNN